MDRLKQSPVNQHFIWIAEYYDGTYLSEFNFDNKKENSFNNIQKDKLIRFGLNGQGVRLYYEVFGGVFKILGMMFEFSYKTKMGKEYLLTGQQSMYRDIISYKDAEQFIDLRKGRNLPVNIFKYNFGYKSKIKFDDIEFYFKPICSIPVGEAMYFDLNLSSNKDLDGYFCIKKNGKSVVEIDAPLEKNTTGNLNWVVK